MKQFFYFVFLIVFLFSCKKTSEPDFHFDYFGMEEGRYVIYDVMEIVHVSTTVHDTTRYQLKTVWGDVYVDNEGVEGRLFKRYTRNSASESWTYSDTWSGRIDGIRAELVEENERKVKLIFAPSIAKEWDANAYNTEDEIYCYYTDIHQEYDDGVNVFDSTIVVDLGDDESAIHQTFREEIYANNIGLIKKEERLLTFIFGQTVPNGGTELHYSYVDSGVE